MEPTTSDVMPFLLLPDGQFHTTSVVRYLICALVLFIILFNRKINRTGTSQQLWNSSTHHEELIEISPVVGGSLPQSISGHLSRLPPAGDDGLWVNLLGDQKLRLLRKKK